MDSSCGILAYGSSYLPGLPAFRQWHGAAFVPIYSGWSATDLHRLPPPRKRRFRRNRSVCQGSMLRYTYTRSGPGVSSFFYPLCAGCPETQTDMLQ